MKKGSIAKFKTVVDPGDDEIRMVLLEDPDGGRVLAADLVNMNILPTRRILVDDIEPVDPEELEADERSLMVWVFPRAGERYHKRECAVIAVFPSPHTLDSGIRSRYRPCSHCKPEGKENGSLVYCFPKAGEVYHQQYCSLVTRYVIEMEYEEAVEAGYTPCRVCGGGSG